MCDITLTDDSVIVITPDSNGNIVLPCDILVKSITWTIPESSEKHTHEDKSIDINPIHDPGYYFNFQPYSKTLNESPVYYFDF